MERKGSVRRAREMLEAGKRHEPRMNAEVPPPPKGNITHMTQWPLPSENFVPNVIDPHGRLLTPQGPPPPRPPRPDLPSPSVYSERSVQDVAPSPLYIKRPVPSFSQPLSHPSPPRTVVRPPPPPSPSTDEGSTPRVSVATADLLRHSTLSMATSVASIPDFPFPNQHLPADPMQRSAANLAPPPPIVRPPVNRRSSVSPIPEERSDGKGSFASSRMAPASWCSGKAESEILGTYLDGVSDDEDDSSHPTHGNQATLVRQASIGKRTQPSVCMIRRSTVESPVAPPEDPVRAKPPVTEEVPLAFSKEVSVGKARRGSFLTSSSDSSHFDLDKAPFVLDVSQQHATSEHEQHDTSALAKEMGALPRAMPTMSDKRPGGRRPPPLNLDAVRNAEKRGSLTSLPDLIRRATKLATNLEHGRTASRNDLLGGGGGARFPYGQQRGSGSLKDILASFPPPAATPENGHSSWPFFFRRSTLHQLHSRESGPRDVEEKEQKKPRRCCGLPIRGFIVLCFIVLIVILIAVLVPILVTAMRKHKINSALSGCAKTAPCENGGVSVSSGDICSCVCANGYTGSRCTMSGDASCTTTIAGDGSRASNATMGSELPRLFEDSQNNYSIPLDSMTIMALFSQNNVSCTTENTLVSFRGVSNSKARRVLPVSLDAGLRLQDQPESAPTITATNIPTRTLAARGSVSTMNGIIFDGSEPTEVHRPPTSATPLADAATATATTATSTPTATVSTEVLDFSRIAVLYIFEKTGTLDAAMLSETRIEKYLGDSYSSSQKHNCTINLSDSGLKGKYTLDFDEFHITTPSGDVIGGN